MIVEYIRYTITDPERQKAFEIAYTEAQASLQAAPECLNYELSRCVEDPSKYILRIAWTSAEGHKIGFRKGPHFLGFLRKIRSFVSEIDEMRHYTQTDVVYTS